MQNVGSLGMAYYRLCRAQHLITIGMINDQGSLLPGAKRNQFPSFSKDTRYTTYKVSACPKSVSGLFNSCQVVSEQDGQVAHVDVEVFIQVTFNCRRWWRQGLCKNGCEAEIRRQIDKSIHGLSFCLE